MFAACTGYLFYENFEKSVRTSESVHDVFINLYKNSVFLLYFAPKKLLSALHYY